MKCFKKDKTENTSGSVGREFTLLYGLFREILTDKITFEKKLENGEGDDLGKEHSRQRGSKCKEPEDKGQSR